MNIQILSRTQALSVDSDQWRQLAENSFYSNPFFEDWMLLPALAHLQTQAEVYLVVAYKEDRLVALFPIKKVRRRWGLGYLSVWKHRHCFLTDPLCVDPSDLTVIINQLMGRFKLSMLRITDHSLYAYGRDIHSNSIVIPESRGAIFKSHNIEQYLLAMPRKTRLENKRISRRFFRQTHASYVTSEDDKKRNWFKAFCELEHSGWKQKVKGSILSSQSDYQFYRAVFRTDTSREKIKFQGLFNESEAFAISFRLISNGHAFDVKTSFNETYKSLYPGVNLELCNMHGLASENFSLVDSCTLSNNYLINRLWPHQRKIYTSLYFHKGPLNQILKRLYQFKNRRALHKKD